MVGRGRDSAAVARVRHALLDIYDVYLCSGETLLPYISKAILYGPYLDHGDAAT